MRIPKITITTRAVWLVVTLSLTTMIHPITSNAGEHRIDSMFQLDQLEYSFNKNEPNALRFNAQGWVGGDYNRLWINTQGSRIGNGSYEDTDVQALYGRLVSPFWDLQTGLRYLYPRADGSKRGSAVFGIQGLAPYWFDIQAASFVSDRGEISGRVEVEYELLLTQRLILQPRMESDAAIQQVKELGVGSGINSLEFGLRLRYEIRREFAPYIGVSWQRQYGETASLTRARGEDIRSLGLVFGLRAWF